MMVKLKIMNINKRHRKLKLGVSKRPTPHILTVGTNAKKQKTWDEQE